MTEFLELEAPTVALALRLAEERTGLAEDSLELEVLARERRRWLGLGRSVPARIRVQFDPALAHRVKARTFLQGILDQAGLELTVSLQEPTSKVDLRLAGPDEDRVTRDGGDLMDALERIVQRAAGPGEPRIRLDAADFRRDRQERLREWFDRLTREAAQGGEAICRDLVEAELRELRRRILRRRKGWQARVLRRRGRTWLVIRSDVDRSGGKVRIPSQDAGVLPRRRGRPRGRSRRR